MDPGDRPTGEEMDGIVAQLRDAGLLTLGTECHETWTLTPDGAQVARITRPALADGPLDAVGFTPYG